MVTRKVHDASRTCKYTDEALPSLLGDRQQRHLRDLQKAPFRRTVQKANIKARKFGSIGLSVPKGGQIAEYGIRAKRYLGRPWC